MVGDSTTAQIAQVVHHADKVEVVRGVHTPAQRCRSHVDNEGAKVPPHPAGYMLPVVSPGDVEVCDTERGAREYFTVSSIHLRGRPHKIRIVLTVSICVNDEPPHSGVE